MGHLVAVFDQIFQAANLGARLKPYEIMATSPTAGVIEVRHCLFAPPPEKKNKKIQTQSATTTSSSGSSTSSTISKRRSVRSTSSSTSKRNVATSCAALPDPCLLASSFSVCVCICIVYLLYTCTALGFVYTCLVFYGMFFFHFFLGGGREEERVTLLVVRFVVVHAPREGDT